jgi:hypothetical protein
MHYAVYSPHLARVIDISQYRLLFGFSLQYYIRTVFRSNCLTAQLSYEGRAAVEGAN